MLTNDMVRKITALTPQKRNHRRVNVFLDGEFAFGLANIVAAWLQVGTELNEEKITALLAADEREVLYQRALHLLSYRPRTNAEIRKFYESKSVREEIIVELLERLKSSGLIDDSVFAQSWVENRSEFRPRSRRAISYELMRRGIQSELIEQSVSQLDEDELAFQAARRQARKITYLDWKEFRQKMLRHLSNRGFNYEVSSAAIRKVWEEDLVLERNFDEGDDL